MARRSAGRSPPTIFWSCRKPPMLIAQITDTHIKLPGKLAYKKVDTAAMLRACVAELLALKPQPDLILLTGDLVDLGRPEEYDHLKSILAPLRQRIIAIPGNHDGRDSKIGRAACRERVCQYV